MPTTPDRRGGPSGAAPAAARILSVGTALPAEVVTSAELEVSRHLPAGWVESRLGVRTRRRAADGQLAYHLGTTAARQALARAGVPADRLDAIVFATMFCDYLTPGGAVLVQRDLGGRPVPAFDVRDQCAGFLYGLSLADALVRAGRGRRVLVVCAERQHETLLAHDGAAPLFGDAGSAVLIGEPEGEAPDGRGILAIDVGADGRGAEMAIAGWEDADWFAPELRHQPEMARARAETAGGSPGGGKVLYWNGPEMFRAALATLVPSAHAVLARAGVSPADVDWCLFQQTDRPLHQALVRQLRLDPARCPANLDRHGNTTSASIPLLLAELVDDGRIRPGQLLLFAAFGAGYAWGSALVRW